MISLQHRRIAWLVALLAVVGIGLVTYASARSYAESEGAVHRTLAVRAAIADTMSLLKDAETGQRGYFLTGDGAFLAPYAKAEREMGAQLQRLEQQTADDPAEERSTARVRALSRQKLDVLAQLIELQHQGHKEEALAIVREGKGNRLMDALRAETGRMLEREATRLQQRERDAVSQQRRALGAVGAGLALALAIALAGLWTIRRDVAEVRLANSKLASSEQKLRNLADNAVDLIRIIDAEANFVYVSPSSQPLLGHSPEEVRAMQPYTILHPDDVERARALTAEARRTGKPVEPFVHRLRRKDGSYLWVETRIQPAIEEAGLVGHLHLTSRDIDAQKRTEKELAENEQRFRTLSEATFEGLAISKNGQLVDANANFLSWVGRDLSELVGTDGLSLFALEDREHVARSSSQELVYEARLLRSDGTTLPVEVRGRTAKLHGEVVRIASLRDITERKKREQEVAAHAEQLRTLSLRDELTGLYNRRGFMEHARQQLRTSARVQRTATLFFADLNGLKLINDGLGHDAGDRAIASAAAVLCTVFRKSDVVARLGGDEFAVVALDCDAKQLPVVRARLDSILNEFNSGGQEAFRLSMSMGAAIFDAYAPIELERLLEIADARMYEDKRAHAQSHAPHDALARQS